MVCNFSYVLFVQQLIHTFRENVSPLVTGVSHAVYSCVSSIAEGHARMAMARASAFALYLM